MPKRLPAVFRTAMIVLFLAYLVWNSLYYMPYTVDDAFVSFRYARNLAEGRGLVYNPGERVEGYSNFTWVLVSAVVMKLGLPFLVSLKILGLVVAVLLALATFDLVRLILAGSRWRDAGSLFALGLVCTNTSLAVWSQAGLEANFFGFLLVLTVARFERELERAGSRPWSAVLFAVIAMTRPEGLLYSVYFVGRLAVRAARWGERRRALRWGLVALPILGAYELWGWWYYHALFPNTYLAKTGHSSGSGLTVLIARLSTERYFGRFLFGQGWGFLVLLALGVIGTVTSVRKAWGLWIPVVAGLAFVLYAGGDWMPRHRLFVPIVPLLLATCAFGAAQIARFGERRLHVAVPVALVVLASSVHYAVVQSFAPEASVKVLAGSYARVGRGAWWLEVPERWREQRYPLESLALAIVQSAPEDEYVVIRDIGFPGYFSNNRVWDVFGLVTRASAVARRDSSDAAQQAAVDDLLACDPAMILLRLGREGSYARDLLARLRQDPRFGERFVVDERRIELGARKESSPQYHALYRRADLPRVSGNARLTRAIERLDGAPLSAMMRTALR